MLKKLILFIALLCFYCHFIHANDHTKIKQSYGSFFQSISDDGNVLTLNDGSSFTIGWWYRSIPKKWQKDAPLYIIYDSNHKQWKIEHTVSKEVVWGGIKTYPFNRFKIDSKNYAGNCLILTLDNESIFISTNQLSLLWEENDTIVIFSTYNGNYLLWNITKNKLSTFEQIIIDSDEEDEEIVLEDILDLEDRLNKKIIQQEQATKEVATSLITYYAGLKKQEQPIGVFLFLGPTGVGKSELAKVLVNEVYKDPTSLLRFDMTQFSQEYSSVRLIGSPPGYVDHKQGGQLTEPLKKNPNTLVLLDEMEKAHSKVHKMFLSVFDEGVIFDSNNIKVDCSDAIFIMTSNLCGPEIAKLYTSGHSDEEILTIIEPKLIQALSPELYNRVKPVIFHPLAHESMGALVDINLNELVNRLWEVKEIRLNIDDSLRNFLIEKGYHPLLGARPLKHLIDKEVMLCLAQKIIKEKIEKGSEVTLIYDYVNESVIAYRHD